LLLAMQSSKDEATVLAQARAQQVAVTGECASSGDLLGLVAEVITLNLDVLSAQRAGGNGGGDFEHEQWAELRLEDQIGGRRNAGPHDAS
jgi:hypothetical protein